MSYTTESIQNAFAPYEAQVKKTADFYNNLATDSRKLHMGLLGELLTKSAGEGQINGQLAQEYAMKFDEQATESAYKAITAGSHSDVLKSRIVKSGLGINPGQAFIQGLNEQSIADFNGAMYQELTKQDVGQISMAKYVSDAGLAQTGDKNLGQLYQISNAAKQGQQAQSQLEQILAGLNGN